MNDWITPRDGFRQRGVLRTSLDIVEAVLIVVAAVGFVFLVALEGVHP